MKDLPISEWPFFNVSSDDKLSRLTTGRISSAEPVKVSSPSGGHLVAELDALSMASIQEKLQKAIAKEVVEALQGDIQKLAKGFVSAGSTTSSAMVAAVDLAALEARVACLVPSVLLDEGRAHRATFGTPVEVTTPDPVEFFEVREKIASITVTTGRNFGFGTIGYQVVRDTKSWAGYKTERNRAKKERRKLKGKK